MFHSHPGQGAGARGPTISYADANGMCRVGGDSSSSASGVSTEERLLTWKKAAESDLAQSKEPELVIRLAHSQLVSFVRHYAANDEGTISRLFRVGEHQPVAVGTIQFPWHSFFVLLAAQPQQSQRLLAQTKPVYLGYWSKEQRLAYKQRRWITRVLSIHPHDDVGDAEGDNNNSTHQLVWEYMTWPLMVMLYICARAQEHSHPPRGEVQGGGGGGLDDELKLLLTELLAKCSPAQLSQGTYPSGFNVLWMAVASHNQHVLTTVLDYWAKAVPTSVFLEHQVRGVDFWHRVLPITVLSYYDQEGEGPIVLQTLLRHPVLEPCRSLVYLCAPSRHDDHLTMMEAIRAARDCMAAGVTTPSSQDPRAHPYLRPSAPLQLDRTTTQRLSARSWAESAATGVPWAQQTRPWGAGGEEEAHSQEHDHHQEDTADTATHEPVILPSASVVQLLGDFFGIHQRPILGTLGFRSHKDTSRFAHARAVAELFQTTVEYARQREMPVYISLLVDSMNCPAVIADVICSFLFDFRSSVATNTTAQQEQAEELAWRQAASVVSRAARTHMSMAVY